MHNIDIQSDHNNVSIQLYCLAIVYNSLSNEPYFQELCKGRPRQVSLKESQITKSNDRYFFYFFRPIAYLGVYILRKSVNYVDQSWLNL